MTSESILVFQYCSMCLIDGTFSDLGHNSVRNICFSEVSNLGTHLAVVTGGAGDGHDRQVGS